MGGILKCLVAGERGEAYNLGNIESDIGLKDLAEMVAEIAGVKVVYDLPDEKEARGSQKQQSQDWIIRRRSGNLGFGRNLTLRVACGEQLRLYVKNDNVFKDSISVG